jgi:hypothetical protein
VDIGVGAGVGTVAAMPARTGNTELDEIVIVLPRSAERTGVMRVNEHVSVTSALSPSSVPVGKLGAGSVPGRVQFRAAASARICSS